MSKTASVQYSSSNIANLHILILIFPEAGKLASPLISLLKKGSKKFYIF